MNSGGVLEAGSATILVVDDEAGIRGLTAEALIDFDYRVLQAASGEEAVALYGEQGTSIDLVILDLNMPGMGGYQCLQELLLIDPGVRVLVASGYSVGGHAAEILNRGAAGFIGKPYQLNELLAKLREVLGDELSVSHSAAPTERAGV